jgi:outer membrane protein TolC
MYKRQAGESNINPRVIALGCLALCLVRNICAQQAPPDPSKPLFSAGGDQVRQRIARPAEPSFALDSSIVYNLASLIDIAESRNPETKQAWQAARAQAAALGIARSDLYPVARAFLLGFTSQTGVLLFNQFAQQDLGLAEAGLSLDYTLFDFGARLDRIHQQRSLLEASNFAFNDTHRKLIFAVTQQYYQVLSAAGLRRAAEASLKSADAVAEATQARYDNGLATLPDVAEARSADAQASYDLQLRIGDEQKATGRLATLLTAPPYSQFKTQSIEDLTVPDTLPDNAHELIELALHQRPDLLAQLARIDAAQAEAKKAKKAFYPTLAFSGEYGKLHAWGDQTPYPNAYATGIVYDASLRLSWTFFDGGRRQSELAQARAAEKEAETALNVAQDQIESEVWDAYVNAQTALHQRQAATALLQASQESYDMSLEAYRAGVRNVLDVLQAERQLAVARSEDVTARAAVLNSMAEISFRTGELLRRQAGQHP